MGAGFGGVGALYGQTDVLPMIVQRFGEGVGALLRLGGRRLGGFADYPRGAGANHIGYAPLAQSHRRAHNHALARTQAYLYRLFAARAADYAVLNPPSIVRYARLFALWHMRRFASLALIA